MYSLNSEWIRLRPNPLGIAKVCAKPKNSNLKPVTDGYTRPLATSKKAIEKKLYYLHDYAMNIMLPKTSELI
jgi:hypothetical protein